MALFQSLVFALALALALLSHAASAQQPTVQLDSGTFTGRTTASAPHTQSFLGIPFAQPPVGDLRFRLPVAYGPYNGSFTATAMGAACPQQRLIYPDLSGLSSRIVNPIVDGIYKAITPDSEDCLYLNVITPTSANATSKLPVVVWIYGGGFQVGSTSESDGTVIVERSVALNKPVIYVSIAYRVSAFGFLAGTQVKEAGLGNIGLQDQRLALRWVQKYISVFGGDPSKVTIWGESAGAISVSLHMVANQGDPEGLFRGAFMQSGSPIPVGAVDSAQAQRYFDQFVSDAGCSAAADPLACLRLVPYDTLKTAQQSSPGVFSYTGLALAWLPRADGVFFTDNPQTLVSEGAIAPIPVVTGDCDDEGTMFAFATRNLTTEAEFPGWVKQVWYPDITDDQLTQLATLYPATVINGLTPQFNRIATYQGDVVFEAPRRFFQNAMLGKQNQWAFLSKRLKATPFLGSYHSSDLPPVYSQGNAEIKDAIIYFTNNLDPNGPTMPVNWPQYTASAPNMLTLYDLFPANITQDSFRVDGMQFLMDLGLELPL